MYFPQMIEAGMIYKAVPPLYSIKQGTRTRYFTEQIDIVKYVQKVFLDKYNITTMKKVKLENKQVTLFFMRNADYIYHLERIANTYAIQPYLLELVLNHYILNKNKINIEKLQKEISSVYRFMNARKVKDSIIIEGVIDKSNLIIFNEKFLADCNDILNIINENDELYYLINGEKKSLYQIMQIYESAMPTNVQRYKGLGEMGDKDLSDSTLDPLGNRTLIRYTLQDAKEELEAIREYESDTKKLLALTGRISRDDLMD